MGNYRPRHRAVASRTCSRGCRQPVASRCSRLSRHRSLVPGRSECNRSLLSGSPGTDACYRSAPRYRCSHSSSSCRCTCSSDRSHQPGRFPVLRSNCSHRASRQYRSTGLQLQGMSGATRGQLVDRAIPLSGCRLWIPLQRRTQFRVRHRCSGHPCTLKRSLLPKLCFPSSHPGHN
jgi:hypothetical protein